MIKIDAIFIHTILIFSVPPFLHNVIHFTVFLKSFLSINWEPSIIPKEAAKCFSEAKLYYGKENSDRVSRQ